MTENINPTVVGAILALLGDEAKSQFENEAWRHRDTDIEYSGSKLTLPASPKPMTLEAAKELIERKIKEENTFMDLIERIDGYPYDAAVALLRAMKETYGWASPVPTPGFFGPKNPDLLTVKIGPDPQDTIQVPMGSFRIPNVEHPILVHITDGDGDHGTDVPTLCIHSKARKREQHVLKDLVAKAKQILANESIYKGKALELTVDEYGHIDRGLQPKFIHTKHINTDELIFSKAVQDQLDVSLFTPIRHTELCVLHNIPLKRGILLSGRYGVGKSMTATVLSRICVENVWTFILVNNVSGLREALEFAKAYQPAVVFAEDIDRQVSERDEKANDLLNVISGVLSSNSRIITVLSTNHVERINQAMLRPGRLDAVISVLPPDADAVCRLVRLYSRDLLGSDEPLNRVGEILAGQIPATIREVCERSKLSMIHSNRSRIIEDDLVIAAEGMMPHLELLNRPEEPAKTAAHRLGQALAEMVGAKEEDGTLTVVAQRVDNVLDRLRDVHQSVHEVYENVANAGNGSDHSEQLEEISQRTKTTLAKVTKIERSVS